MRRRRNAPALTAQQSRELEQWAARNVPNWQATPAQWESLLWLAIGHLTGPHEADNPPRLATVAEARRDYRRLHWGERGHNALTVLPVADPREGVVPELGELVSVVYRTTKDEKGECDWEHEFDPPRPILCYTLGARRLLIAGGDYRIEERGIVG